MSFDPKPYAEGIMRLNAIEEERIREKAILAREEARRLASEIRERDGAVRSVFLFGSLAEGGPRRLDFDIDLALDGGDLYRALDITEESSFPVDLVDLRLVPPELAARIREFGERL
jgi:predicted nucleotidyltransferase